MKLNKELYKEFNYLKGIYLNNASTTPIPKTNIKILNNLLSHSVMSIDRDINKITFDLHHKINILRKRLSIRFDCNISDIIFTHGFTDSFNTIINILIIKILIKQIMIDRIIITNLSHNSVSLPLIRMSKICNIPLIMINVTDNNGRLINNYMDNVNKYKHDKNIICSPFMSNITGIKINMYKKCYNVFKNSIRILDFSQGFDSFWCNKSEHITNTDIIIFSAHKFFGLKKTGFIVAKQDIQKYIFYDNKHKMPLYSGGGSIIHWDNHNINFKTELYDWIESGTKSFTNIMSISYAIDFIEKYYTHDQIEYINTIKHMFIQSIKHNNNIEILSNHSKSWIICLYLKQHHAHDVQNKLLQQKIYIRTGNFCSHLFVNSLSTKYYGRLLRISFSIYNSINDIKKLSNILNNEFK